MIIVSNWTGRLGNNITQIVNALAISLYYNCDLMIPKHNILKSTLIKIPNSTNKIKIKQNFFSRKKLTEKFNLQDEVFNKSQIIDIICDLRLIDYDKIELDENDLVIHIRSGDIMSPNPHGGWVQPPLCFYEKVIDENHWNNIYIISQDKKKPVTNKLLEKYSNIIFSINTLHKDIQFILNSKNLCFGFGSFIPALLLFNKQIQKIYYPSYCHRYLLDYYNKEKTVIDLPGYIKVGEWRFSKKQRKIMINYKIN